MQLTEESNINLPKSNLENLIIKFLIAILLLTIFGLLMVFSASIITVHNSKTLNASMAINQSIKGMLGILLMFFIGKYFDYKLLFKYRVLILLSAIIGLVLVLIIGKEINGSKRWLDLHFINFQVSEFARLALIIYTSAYIVKNREKLKNFYSVIFFYFAILLIFFLLILFEPDFSMGFLVTVVPAILLFIYTDKIKTTKHLPIILLLLALIFVVGIFLQPYRIERIKSFYSNKGVYNEQQYNALKAIASGGILKFDIGGSHQKVILPEAYNDFIFAIICEELGFIGGFLVIVFYGYILYLGLMAFKLVKDEFGKNLIFGIVLSLNFFALVHIMVSLQLMPTTGVTLPFISFGGTSLLINLTGAGIIFSILQRELKNEKKEIYLH